MTKSFKFQCWNCSKKYRSLYMVTDAQKLLTKCPFCHAEAVVDLSPYAKDGKIIVMRKENDSDLNLGDENFPDILSTQQPEE